jgi:hypothetical protein
VAKLNQILAIEKGVKATSNRGLTDLHRVSEKPDLYEGRTKTYAPRDVDGETLPTETQVVQQSAADILKQLAGQLVPLWDITATKDYANCDAKADVIVDGSKLLVDVPVSYLLFLEKQLNDLETVYSKLPTLDASQRWQYDENQQLFTTDKITQNRMKKIPRNHVKAEATAQHPAQVEVYQEEVVVGAFEITRQSGAFSARQKATLLDNVRKLKAAVLFAREQANSVEVDKKGFASSLLDFLTKS